MKNNNCKCKYLFLKMFINKFYFFCFVEYISLDMRKKIVEKIVIVVVEWCKENFKKLINFNMIYILNNDIEFIKIMIECFKNYIWKEEYLCVKWLLLFNF